MKKYLFVFVALFVFGIMQSCKDSSTKTETIEVAKDGIEYTSKYVCPMHCQGSGSAEEGVCPVCGMDYVLNEDFKDEHEGHNHEH